MRAILLLVIVVLLAAGCSDQQAQPEQPQPPVDCKVKCADQPDSVCCSDCCVGSYVWQEGRCRCI
ncbi:MAG: hypothetical protein P9M14_07350 [Candidatus Alcyoniella australis]|nr:hypothetical protein [Candidatus Alcyoniella australis]